MSPWNSESDRFHGIESNHPSGFIKKGLSEGKLTSDDAELILSFIAEREVTNNIGVKRAYKLASSLVALMRIIGPFRENSIVRIYDGIKELNSGTSKRGPKYKDNTKRNLIIALKMFYLWLIENSEVTLSLKNIKANRTLSKIIGTKNAQDILTSEDVHTCISACMKSRDQALFLMMYEGGFRVGEIGLFPPIQRVGFQGSSGQR
jgi:site-specific recombinase XerC